MVSRLPSTLAGRSQHARLKKLPATNLLACWPSWTAESSNPQGLELPMPCQNRRSVPLDRCHQLHSLEGAQLPCLRQPAMSEQQSGCLVGRSRGSSPSLRSRCEPVHVPSTTSKVQVRSIFTSWVNANVFLSGHSVISFALRFFRCISFN
jgi:hypothetical protein